MAKKEQQNSSGFSLDDLINSEFTEMQDLSKEDDSVKEWIDSGNYALNYVCSKNFYHAYPVGQITAFYGQSGTGKSMLPAIASKDPKSVQSTAIAFSIHILLKSIIFSSISTLATSLTKSIT